MVCLDWNTEVLVVRLFRVVKFLRNQMNKKQKEHLFFYPLPLYYQKFEKNAEEGECEMS